MLNFFIKRIISFFIMLVVMSVVAFTIIQAPPGDYVEELIYQMELSGESMDDSEAMAMREHYGLLEPMYVQYFKWAKHIITWDLGMSLSYNRSVNEMINERLLLTIALGLFTILFTWTLAIPIGMISAIKKYTWIDYFFTMLSYVGVGTPNFMLAIIIMYVTLTTFGLSISGLFSFEYIDAPWSFGKFVDMLKHIWVPMIILGTDGTARFTRIMRANLLDEMNKPYVETARAKGVPEWKLLIKYPMRIAINPFISTAGWALPELFSGSLIVATVMNLPTIGPLLLQSLLGEDMHMAGSIIMILTALTLIGTLISDILLAIVDPRIRMSQT